jgi:hypothetical protein
LSVSEGIVSGYRAFGTGRPIIQHTASISHGSSGGALFDEAGNLLGLTTSMYADAQNLNFAISIETIRDAAAKALEFSPMSLAAAAEAFRIRAIANGAAAVRSKDTGKLKDAGARLLAAAGVSDAHSRVCQGVGAYYEGDFDRARALLGQSVSASGQLDAVWSRTARLFLAAAIGELARQGRSEIGRPIRLEAVEAFLAAEGPSLLEGADEAQFVSWATAVRAALTTLEGRWSSPSGLSVLKGPTACELRSAQGPLQMVCDYSQAAGSSHVAGTLSRRGNGLSGRITIDHIIKVDDSATDICQVQADVTLDLAADGEALTGQMTIVSMKGGLASASSHQESVTCRLLTRLSQASPHRALSLRRVE